jgi:transcriptional regulator with XRE-family HTH domain
LPSTDLARIVEKCSTGAVKPTAVETLDFKVRFPKLLRESRTKTGITIRALARRSGIDATYLSRMERGLVPPPTAAKLGAIVSQLPSSELSRVVGDRENEKIKLALTESTEVLLRLIGEALPMAALADRAWLDSIKRRLKLCVAVIEVSEQKAGSSKSGTSSPAEPAI